MVNLEHKLTVDDLIVEYMMYKVKNGYEPSFTTAEFITLLYFFESKMEVADALYLNEKLFNRFFERKAEHGWSIIKDYHTMEKEVKPHMEMIYSEKDNDYLIKANYKLSDFDSSIINTHFMTQRKKEKIRSIIREWLADYPKRKIDESIDVDENDLLVGKYTAAEIIANIWDSHIKGLIENQKWPKQCSDINKYLLEMNLAEVIGLKSIKNELIELYNVLSKRIAILYHQDRNLKISSYGGSYLARANCELIIQGYEKIMSTAFGKNKKSLDIDLSTLTFKESHEIDGVYDWDEDPDVKTTTTIVGNENVKKLIRSLDTNISNN